MQKGSVVLWCVLGLAVILLAITGYYYWGLRQNTQIHKLEEIAVSKPTPAPPSPSPSFTWVGPNPPTPEPSPTPWTTFVKRNFDPTKNDYLDQKYPQELINYSGSELVAFKCSQNYFQDGDKFDTYNAENNQVLTDTSFLDLLKQADAKTKITNMSFAKLCQTEDGRLIFSYDIQQTGGGAGQDSYYALLNQGEKLSNSVEIKMEPFAYFSCSAPLELTKTGILYVSCGAGDGGGVSSSIYKIDFNNNTSILVEHCDNSQDQQKVSCSTKF